MQESEERVERKGKEYIRVSKEDQKGLDRIGKKKIIKMYILWPY